MANDVDAVVLAGGGSRRMGQDKALVDVGGRTLLARVLDAAAGCGTVVVVGPARPGVSGAVEFVDEDPPGSGPVHGLAAGVARVAAPWVLVLACDLPFVSAATTSRLIAAGAGAEGAIVTDGDRDNPLCGVYRTTALRAALGRLEDTRGAAMEAVVRQLDLVRVVDHVAASDCDTPGDVDRARRRVTQ